MSRALAAAALAVTASLASAQEAERRAAEFDVVSLQAEMAREIENDQLVAVLAVEVHGSNPAELAATVNRRMAEALKLASAYPGVKLRSGNYQTFPRYNKERRIESWQASQELRLESAEFEGAARLLGRLQENLLVRSMAVRLSPEARRAAEDALIAEAIAAFHARAELARKAMKAAGYRTRNLSIGTSSGGIPRPMEFAARAAAAPIAVEGGVSLVTVTVSGSIQLQ